MRRVAPSDEAREIARAAARWLILLESGAADADDHARLQNWRDSSCSHENAWQKAQQLRERFSGLPPALAMATLDSPGLARRAVLKQALGLAALAPGAWLLGRQLPLDEWRADLHTGTGERRLVPLADGSMLQLNTASAANFDPGIRQLTLVRGEMALRVPGSRPLTIQAPYGRITLGQAEVCVRLDERACRVSVFSGAVRLQPLHGPLLMLHEGQRVSLRASGAGPIDAFDALSADWRAGVLLALDQPLGDFLRELSRYRPGMLRWEPELEALRVTGSFRLDDTDRVLSLLAASLPLEVHSRTRYWVSLTRKNIG